MEFFTSDCDNGGSVLVYSYSKKNTFVKVVGRMMTGKKHSTI